MTEGTLYLNPARQQFFLVPKGEVLPDGVFFVILVPDGDQRWPSSREVARSAIERFAISQEEARALIGDRLGGAYGGARTAFQKVLDDASRMASEREVPGGSAVKTLAGRLGRAVRTPQVEKGLSLLGQTFLDMAESIRQRREDGEPAPESPGPRVRPEAELVLCPYCLSEVDEEDDLCDTCGGDLAEQEPFVMSASEYASEPWKSCPHCGEEMLRLASVCASCGHSV